MKIKINYDIKHIYYFCRILTRNVINFIDIFFFVMSLSDRSKVQQLQQNRSSVKCIVIRTVKDNFPFMKLSNLADIILWKENHRQNGIHKI